MIVRTAVGPADPALRDFRDLTDVVARSAREPAEGLFIAEGAKVIRRALAAGLHPRTVLTEPKWWPELAGDLAGYDCEVIVASVELVSGTAGYRVHRGALASFARPAPRAVAEVVRGARLVAVLVDLVDHTNVGAIFRNAAALGVDAVVVSPRCADPLYRRSVKVSMGGVFAVPWARSTDWPGDLALLGGQGLRTMALSPHSGGRTLAGLAPTGDDRWAVVLGSEGPGLPGEVLDRCAVRVGIPMRRGVDSLNVAATSAIVFHHLGVLRELASTAQQESSDSARRSSAAAADVPDPHAPMPQP